ncbi:MAG: ATP-binding protein [Solirubrobacteraceae bacterium]
MSSPPTVRLALAARAENVAIVREVLAGVVAATTLTDSLDDLKTAVSEAANNVVLHAYAGAEGPLEVEFRLYPDELEVVVGDRGQGLESAADIEAGATAQSEGRGPGHGLGLAVMEALADRVELRTREPVGFEVVLGFRLIAHEAEPRARNDGPTGFAWPAHPDGEVKLQLVPASLGVDLIDRVICTLAARAGFSIDRLSDAQLLADALAAQLEPVSAGDGVVFAARGEAGRLELVFGPLVSGGAREALASSTIGEIGPVIERLVDEVDTRELDDGHELLELVMLAQR